MRIQNWECVINHDGTVRAAQHVENGSVMWSSQGLVGSAAVPTEVLEWLIRPLLRKTWEAGCVIGLGCPAIVSTEAAYGLNPYDGEPPNKDHDPS